MDTDMFSSQLQPQMDCSGKYPMLFSNYESYNIDNMFFIGSLMHSSDNKKSSGGFIHGFRYLIESFVRMNYTAFEYNKLETCDQVVETFMHRINVSSALYQMFGVLCDIFFKHESSFFHVEQVPLQYLLSNLNTKLNIPNTVVFIVTLEFNPVYETNLQKIGDKPTSIGRESNAQLLHPVVRIFDNKSKDMQGLSLQRLDLECDDIVHFDEHLTADFTNDKKYKNKFMRLIKSYGLD